MKKFSTPKTSLAILAAFLLATGVLPTRAATTNATIAREIETLVAPIQKLPDQYEARETLNLMALALARLGNLDSALRISNAMPKNDWQADPRDEIWRITSRRLAWQGNLAAASRSANRVQSEYSRADALLAISRAQLRNGNPSAAKTILLQVAPVIRQSKSPHAISYLAFLFTRVGDNKTARELFAHAKVAKDPNSMEKYGLSDRRKIIIALYQAKAGFSNEAIETARGDVFSLSPVKAILAQRREWQPLRAFAETLPPAPATNFLLELSGAQLKARDLKAARASYLQAESKFGEIPESQFQGKDKNRNKVILPFTLAVFQAATGDVDGGRAKFAQIEIPPGMKLELELTFHSFLAGFMPEIATMLTSQQQEEEANLAFVTLSKTQDSSTRLNFLKIFAVAQQKRGDLSALRQTLALFRREIRVQFLKPLDKEKLETMHSRRYSVLYSLLSIAKIERDAGLKSQAQSTLLQAKLHEANFPQTSFAFALLSSGFPDEAAQVLYDFVTSSDTRELEKTKNTSVNNWNPLARSAAQHAIQSGASEPLKWVLKISDSSLRAKCLSAIAYSQTRTPIEESEIILNGESADTIGVSARIRIPNYGSSYNFDDDLD